MTLMWKSFLSLSCLLIFTEVAVCQDIRLPVPPDTVRNFTPAALRVGVSITDALKASFFDAVNKEYSLEADLALDRYMLVADFGHTEYARGLAEAASDTAIVLPYQYTTRGNYFKVGVDVNFFKDKETKSQKANNNVVTFGLRYAQSNMKSDVTFDAKNPVWGDYTFNRQNINQTAWWLEMVAGMKIKIVSNIFFGYTMQFRFLKSIKGDPSLIPYDVPGFGSKGEDRTSFGFDYYVFYRIPFKK